MGETGVPGGGLHLPFPAERFLAYLSTSDIAELQKDDAAVILPVASIEQHGPHLPVVADSLMCEVVLAQALARVDEGVDLWVLPPLRYGLSSEHRPFAGTMTLSAASLASTVLEIAASVAQSGFRRLIIANGHGGNPGILSHAARDAREQTGLIVFPLTVFRLDEPYPPLGEQEDHWGTHAGTWETSLILELAPELVHLERVDGLEAYPRHRTPPNHVSLRGDVTYAWLTEDLSTTGNLGNPAAATPRLGREIREFLVGRLAEVLTEMSTFEMPIAAGDDPEGSK